MPRDSEGREWVNCLQCEGDEGWYLPDDKWYVCELCNGDGGYWKEVPAEALSATPASSVSR